MVEGDSRVAARLPKAAEPRRWVIPRRNRSEITAPAYSYASRKGRELTCQIKGVSTARAVSGWVGVSWFPKRGLMPWWCAVTPDRFPRNIWSASMNAMLHSKEIHRGATPFAEAEDSVQCYRLRVGASPPSTAKSSSSWGTRRSGRPSAKARGSAAPPSLLVHRRRLDRPFPLYVG